MAGRLFPGKSGSGKSTLASLAPFRKVLSDELVAAVPAPHGFALCGTPFWGSFVRGVSTGRYSLDATYFLERKKKEQLEQIRPADAVTRLLECVLCFVDDEGRMKRILQTGVRLARSAPCFRFSFKAKNRAYKDLAIQFQKAEKS